MKTLPFQLCLRAIKIPRILNQVVSFSSPASYLEVDTHVDDETGAGVEDVLYGHDADESVREVVHPGPGRNVHRTGPRASS